MKDTKHRRKSKNQHHNRPTVPPNADADLSQQRFIGLVDVHHSNNNYGNNNNNQLFHHHDQSHNVGRSKKDHRQVNKNNVIAVKSIATADHLKNLNTPAKDSNVLTTQATVIENLSVGIGGTSNMKDRMPRFSSEHPRERYMAPNLWHKNELKLGEKQVQINSLKA